MPMGIGVLMHTPIPGIEEISRGWLWSVLPWPQLVDEEAGHMIAAGWEGSPEDFRAVVPQERYTVRQAAEQTSLVDGNRSAEEHQLHPL
jgi:hypothetical protein